MRSGQTSPGRTLVNADALALCIEACLDCAQACPARAAAVPLNVAMLEWFGKYTLPDPSQADHPRLSPLLVPMTRLSGLRPVIVTTAESDPLRDQGEAYVRKLMDAGAHVSLTRFPGVCTSSSA